MSLGRLGVSGAFLVASSLLLFRFTQNSASALTAVDWVLLVPVGVVGFVVGSRWLFEKLSFLKPWKGLWPVVCVVYVFVWLLHASQFDVALSESGVGAAFAGFTLRYSSLLLTLSGVHSTVRGDVISMGSLSRVGEIAVTPLCSGFLSFVLFTAAFGVVLFDVGKTLGIWRLSVLFAMGILGTFVISGLRVFLVLMAGYLWGWDALGVAHAYLGYILFLALISFFWYATLNWCRRIE